MRKAGAVAPIVPGTNETHTRETEVEMGGVPVDLYIATYSDPDAVQEDWP